MRRITTTLPLISLIAATRGMLGAGLGLLLAERLTARQRNVAGWTLFIVGAASTVPLASRVLGSLLEEESEEEAEESPAWIGGYFHGCPTSLGLGRNSQQLQKK